jgi:hypothetical protein
MRDLPDMSFRPIKGRGVGVKKDPDAPRKAIKKESKKGRARKSSLREKKEIILNAMHRNWGTTFCMGHMGDRFRNIPCGGELDLAHVKPAGEHQDFMTWNTAPNQCRSLWLLWMRIRERKNYEG